MLNEMAGHIGYQIKLFKWGCISQGCQIYQKLDIHVHIIFKH